MIASYCRWIAVGVTPGAFRFLRGFNDHSVRLPVGFVALSQFQACRKHLYAGLANHG